MARLAVDGGSPVWTRGWPVWPVHDEREVAAVTRVIRSGQWWHYWFGGTGTDSTSKQANQQTSEVVAFQRGFARLHDCRYGVSVTNGTVALEAALRALGVRQGHEVIVPAYTFIATASVVLAINAVPIFVDIEPDTYTIDPNRVSEAISDRTKAIIPVHFGGQPADMDAINAIAAERGLAVLEDAAHAHGSSYQGRKCGSLGDAGAFSFQVSKPMTAGEGGIITTNRRDVAELAESVIWGGRKQGHAWYGHYLLGSNARMTEFQAAILQVQLSRLEAQVETRMENASLLDKLLSAIEGIRPCAVRPTTTAHSYHIYMFRYDSAAFGGMSKARFVEALQAEGISPASEGYGTPVYRNPVFLNRELWGDGCPVDCPRYGRKVNYADFSGNCPISERACATEAVWLNQNALLGGEEEVHAIAAAIRKVQESSH